MINEVSTGPGKIVDLAAYRQNNGQIVPVMTAEEFTILPDFDGYKVEKNLVTPREFADIIDREFQTAVREAYPEICEIYDPFVSELLEPGVPGLTGIYDVKVKGSDVSVIEIGNYYMSEEFRESVRNENHVEQLERTYADVLADRFNIEVVDTETALYYILQHEAAFQAFFLTTKALQVTDPRIASE